MPDDFALKLKKRAMGKDQPYLDYSGPYSTFLGNRRPEEFPLKIKKSALWARLELNKTDRGWKALFRSIDVQMI